MPDTAWLCGLVSCSGSTLDDWQLCMQTVHVGWPHSSRDEVSCKLILTRRPWLATGWPLQYAELGADLGVDWPRGLLLHGPPGCGKTLAARCVAEECGARMHSISAAQIFGAYTGKHKVLCPTLCRRRPQRCLASVAFAWSVAFVSPMHQMWTTALYVSHAPAACSGCL